MTSEQKEMLKNSPSYPAPKVPSRRNKIIAISAGVLVGGIAAYYICPKVLGKLQARRLLKLASAGG